MRLHIRPAVTGSKDSAGQMDTREMGTLDQRSGGRVGLRGHRFAVSPRRTAGGCGIHELVWPDHGICHHPGHRGLAAQG